MAATMVEGVIVGGGAVGRLSEMKVAAVGGGWGMGRIWN